jgi:type IV pilus assembly protein PilC
MNKQLSNQELFHFFDTFGLILHSGISASEGLSLLLEEETDAHGKQLLKTLSEGMAESGHLHESMQTSGSFPDFAISYVRVGEETGTLDEVMKSLAEHYEQEIALSSQIRSAVAYPLLMLGILGAVILILLIKVLPVFSQVFRQMGMEMSGISAALLHTGETISRYSIVFLVILALLIGVIVFITFTPKGRTLFQNCLLHLPRLKEIPAAIDYSRLTQSMALALKSGLGPEYSLSAARLLVGTPQVTASLEKAISELSQGAMFSDALVQSGLFQGVDAQMIRIGFTTGYMDDVMKNLTRRYQEAAAEKIDKAVSVIEPAIVIVMSLLVGLVLLSVMMPLLGILSGLM